MLTGACAVLLLGGCSGEAKGKVSNSEAQRTALAAGPHRFDFERDAAGSVPADFLYVRTGEGHPGRWVVADTRDAFSGSHVLMQSDADATELRFPLALADLPDVVDLDLTVRARVVSGSVDQAFGLVFRCRDADNYYLARANALERNVRFYYVRDGQRTQLRSWTGPMETLTWHTLRVQVRGELIRVWFDGEVVIEAHDTTYSAAGKVGLWTKADSVIQFDDLQVEPLER